MENINTLSLFYDCGETFKVSHMLFRHSICKDIFKSICMLGEDTLYSRVKGANTAGFILLGYSHI